MQNHPKCRLRKPYYPASSNFILACTDLHLGFSWNSGSFLSELSYMYKRMFGISSHNQLNNTMPNSEWLSLVRLLFVHFQESAKLLSQTSGVTSAAQPRFLHHAIVPTGSTGSIGCNLTDRWIDPVIPTTPRRGQGTSAPQVMSPRSGELTLVACIPSTSSRICWARTSKFSRLSGRSNPVWCCPSISYPPSSCLSSYRSLSLHVSNPWTAHLFSLLAPFAPSPLHASYLMCTRCPFARRSWTACTHCPSFCYLSSPVKLKYSQIRSTCYVLSLHLRKSSKLVWESPAWSSAVLFLECLSEWTWN